MDNPDDTAESPEEPDGVPPPRQQLSFEEMMLQGLLAQRKEGLRRLAVRHAELTHLPEECARGLDRIAGALRDAPIAPEEKDGPVRITLSLIERTLARLGLVTETETVSGAAAGPSAPTNAPPAPEPQTEPVRVDLEELHRENEARSHAVMGLESQVLELRVRLVTGTIDVADAIDRVTAHSSAPEALAPVRKQAMALLGRLGAVQVHAEGLRFSPENHQVVEEIPVNSHEQDELVMRVHSPGYVVVVAWAGSAALSRLVRPARVAVGVFATKT